MKIDRFEIVDRCLYWKEQALLVIGDLHLGYEQVLQEGGWNLPLTQFEETAGRLDGIFKYFKKKRYKIKKIILLGDVKHSFSGVLKQEFSDFDKMIKLFEGYLEKDGKIVVIKGNHDNILYPIIQKYPNIIFEEFYSVEDILFFHGDQLIIKTMSLEFLKEKYGLLVAGHFHPAILLKEGAKQEKYKCFLYGKLNNINKKVIFMPSFFPLVEGTDISDGLLDNKIDVHNFEVFIVDEEGNTYEFGRLRKLKI